MGASPCASMPAPSTRPTAVRASPCSSPGGAVGERDEAGHRGPARPGEPRLLALWDDLGPLLQDARAHGHEYLASVPMEPQGYPLNDPGPRALLTGADPATNEHNLEWALIRVPGAVGATGALDGMRGERLAGAADPYAMVQVTLGRTACSTSIRAPARRARPMSRAAASISWWTTRPTGRTSMTGSPRSRSSRARRAARSASPALCARSRWTSGGLGERARRAGDRTGAGERPRPAQAGEPDLSADPAALSPECRGRAVQPRRRGLRRPPRRPPQRRGRAGRLAASPGRDRCRRGPAPGGAARARGGDRHGRAEIIGEHPDWLTYDLPPELVGKALGGRYRGQRQRWFALRFTGTDADIRLDLDPHPEFDAWRWAPLAELPALAVGFKRPIYDILVRSFAGFAVPG